jgi:tetraacyldisaccharide 4'-kinase
VVGRILMPLLYPMSAAASLIFGGVTRVRNHFYDSGFFSSRSLSAPVISVGNITVGGSGKTPFVIHLAKTIARWHATPILLSRGYGRRSKGAVIMRPGEHGCLPSLSLGDEPALFHRHVPDAWVGISAGRWETGRQILPRVARPVFLLDDGFQHRQLKRDLDIVIIDRTQALVKNRLLPSGTLREPPEALRRAHLVVVNGPAGAPAADSIDAEMRSLAAATPLFHCIQEIDRLVPFREWMEGLGESGREDYPRTVFLVAAIGNPRRLARDVQALDIHIAGSRFFRDHSRLQPGDWRACMAEAKRRGASALLTTEKDAVKLVTDHELPIWVAMQSIRVAEQDELERKLRIVMEGVR